MALMLCLLPWVGLLLATSNQVPSARGPAPALFVLVAVFISSPFVRTAGSSKPFVHPLEAVSTCGNASNRHFMPRRLVRADRGGWDRINSSLCSPGSRDRTLRECRG